MGTIPSNLVFLKLLALFTVDVPQPQYIVEYGSNVTMECRFRVNGQLNSYAGRVKLFKDKLQFGQSMLQVTNVKPTDAGTYLCLIGYEGADYKTITLQVKAPYRNITKRTVIVQRTAVHNEWELTCQSKGYPKAEIIWHNGEHQDFSDKANTSYETGTDQLYSVTSVLKTNTSINETFHCIFWNKEFKENTSAILIIPGNYTWSGWVVIQGEEFCTAVKVAYEPEGRKYPSLAGAEK
uniref:CD274 molecule n=1 Tax=Chelydra serpentina TaxID=8475 RepID=A0A8C3TI04_CHESE